MKTKKRHHSISSDETGESDATGKSSSSSNSDSEVSSLLEHRHKKKRKRADSSESDSESDNPKRVKKRKHKKKKKKHGKKKRRPDSADESASDAEDALSVSEGEISSKKRRKHKHKHKRNHSSSVSAIEESHVPRRIHSVVKERRGSSEEETHPVRTYYQKEYRRSVSADYEREREVQRFYRGSSKDRRAQAQEQYSRERPDRYQPYQQNKYDTNRDKFSQNVAYGEYNEDYGRRQRDYNEHKRNPRYEEPRPPEDEYNRRPREDTYSRQDQRGFNQNNRYEERMPKRRDYDNNKEYRERRGPPETERFHEREFQEKKERFRDEYGGQSNRERDMRRDKSGGRPDKPTVHLKEHSRSRSPEYYKERNIKTESKDVRGTRYTRVDGRGEDRSEVRSDGRGDVRSEGRGDVRSDGRGDGRSDARGEIRSYGRGDGRGDGRNVGRGDYRRERNNRSEERKEDHRDVKVEKSRERKSRFTDNNESKEYAWGKADSKKESGKDQGEKEKPNFGLSGKLTAEANTVNGVVIKYTEPDDAKQPKRRWRFYPFKGDKALPILYIHRQSAFLIGRDKKVCDITLEHPSISKQHSALQYRATPFTRPDGSQGRRVRPYVIDLESANGTFVNNKKIEPRRYVELLERDVVKFGFSQREYVLLHENSKDDAQDDDNQEPVTLGASVTTTDKIKQEKRMKQEEVEDGE